MDIQLASKDDEEQGFDIDSSAREQQEALLVDRPMKLRLIELQLLESNNRDYEHICNEILRKFGVLISQAECRTLVRQHHIFTKGRYGLIFVFSLMIAVLTIGFFELGFWSSVVMLALVPLLFNYLSDGMLAFFALRFKPPILLPAKMSMEDEHPSVAVVMPSRNEPFEVAKMTFDSALALNYQTNKKKLVVVDNSDQNYSEYALWRDYVESFAKGGERYIEGLEVVFIHRDGTQGFKPRNLDLALAQIDTEMVFYLDIDSTLDSDSLLRVIPQFKMQPKLGFIQLYTLPTNLHSGSSMAMAQGIKSYLERLQLVFSTHGSYSLFYGHNAIWRTEVVKGLGECLEYHNGDVVVAEDLSMTLRAKIQGFYGKGSWVKTGEWVPCSMRETEAMWLRWTVGTLQVFAKHFKKLIHSREVKTVEAVGWYQHLVLFINGGLLPLFLAIGLVFDFVPFLVLVACSYIPQFIALQGICSYVSLGGVSKFEKFKQSYMSLFVLNSFIQWVRGIGLLRYVRGKKQGWTPTGKAHEGVVPLKDVFVKHVGILLYGFGGLAWCGYVYLNDLAESNFLLGVGAFTLFNILLSVFAFGRARMVESDSQAVSHGTIEQYKDYY